MAPVFEGGNRGCPGLFWPTTAIQVTQCSVALLRERLECGRLLWQNNIGPLEQRLDVPPFMFTIHRC